MKQLLVFAASWCNPCQNYKRVLFDNNIDVDNIHIMDVDESPNLAAEYGVKSVPTTFLLNEGKTKSKAGAMTLEQLKDFLNE
jgi:thioredoxin 1